MGECQRKPDRQGQSFTDKKNRGSNSLQMASHDITYIKRTYTDGW